MALEVLGHQPGAQPHPAARRRPLTLWMPVLALLTFWAGIAGTFTAAVLLYDATPEAFFSQLLDADELHRPLGQRRQADAVRRAHRRSSPRYKGLQVGGGAEGVGRAVNESVVTCFVVIGDRHRRLHAALPGVLPGGELRRMSAPQPRRPRRPRLASARSSAPDHVPRRRRGGRRSRRSCCACCAAFRLLPRYTGEVLRQIGHARRRQRPGDRLHLVRRRRQLRDRRRGDRPADRRRHRRARCSARSA